MVEKNFMRPGRGRLRENEENVRYVIEVVTGRQVVGHDDNSRDGMFDLLVLGSNSEQIAVECVRATDPKMREIGSLVKNGLAIDPYSLKYTWCVRFNRDLDIKATRQMLPFLLQRLESLGVSSTHYAVNSDVVESIIDRLQGFGVESADSLGERNYKSIQMLPIGIGGSVDSSGAQLPDWVGSFLIDQARADVIAKLKRAEGFLHREVFIECDLYGVPWHVGDYLFQQSPYLPEKAPQLPEPLTGVWLGYGPFGVKWDSDGWRSFDARPLKVSR